MMARLWWLTAVAVLRAGGCTDRGPSPAHVRAANFREFEWWRAQIARDIPPQRWAEFNGAVDEIRFGLMNQGLTGADAIGEALATRLNGMAFDDVLRLGDQLKLARLQSARDDLKVMIDANAHLGTKAGDDASREAMQRRTVEQRERLEGLSRQIGDVQRQLLAHGGGLPLGKTFDAAPATLTRTEARADFRRLIGERLENARLMYGDWPARIDRSGADLPPELRSVFDRKRALASTNGHVVIPVYIRAQWRLYDDAVPYPEFSPAVTANLTAEDRHELEEAWAESEAEIWARREARQESADAAIAHIKAQLKNVLRP